MEGVEVGGLLDTCSPYLFISEKIFSELEGRKVREPIKYKGVGGKVRVTRGNASGFWSLTVLLGSQGFLRRLGAPGDLFEFQVRGCSWGFLHGSFGRA